MPLQALTPKAVRHKSVEVPEVVLGKFLAWQEGIFFMAPAKPAP
jgi:hypothetical protein